MGPIRSLLPGLHKPTEGTTAQFAADYLVFPGRNILDVNPTLRR